MTEPAAVIPRDTLAAFLAEFELAPSKKAGGEIVNFIVNALAGALRRGDAVHLKGFGRFAVARTRPRSGRNPKAGEPHAIPARNKVKFKASKGLLGGSEGAA